MATIAQLDKSVDTVVNEGYGTITIRVVVLEKGMAAAAAPKQSDEAPVDAAPNEMLPETDKRPTATFMEEPKRGRQCCVFLINGQRQHAWDNQFIVRDLELKYLRNRMIVVVDCDGLKPEARQTELQSYRQRAGDKLAAFLTGILSPEQRQRLRQGDPDLRRLEEEAEDDISSLQAGDEAVKSALDQLIQAHHEAASHVVHGHGEVGDASREQGVGGSLIQTEEVVIETDTSVGDIASEPMRWQQAAFHSPVRASPRLSTGSRMPNRSRSRG